jgi:hypothetical protein
MEFFGVDNLPTLKRIFLISIFFCMLTMVAMGIIVKPLNKIETGNILELEFMLTEENAHEVMAGWGETERNAAINSTYVDYFFILTYVFSLSSLWILITIYQKNHPWSGFIQFSGALFVLASIFAGLYDLVENIFLINVLNGAGHPAPLITTVFSVLKWSLVLPSLFFGLIAGVFTIFSPNFK